MHKTLVTDWLAHVQYSQCSGHSSIMHKHWQSHHKLPGVFISSDLSWDYPLSAHHEFFHYCTLYLLTYLRTLGIYNLLRKVTKRMYCTNYLFQAGVRPFVIACVWTSIICSILELYACPVWHLGLTKKLSKDIECVQQCHVKLLFPALSYTESLHKSGLERLDDHRDMITQSLFTQIKDPKYPLHYLLPHHTKVSLNHMALRPTYPYQIPLAKTSRYGTNCTVLHCQHHKRQIDGEIM